MLGQFAAAAFKVSGGDVVEQQRAILQVAAGQRGFDKGLLAAQPVTRRTGWERSDNQDGNLASRHWHDCRDVVVAQGSREVLLSRRDDQAFAVTVAWVGGRPRPRLRSSAARRR